MKKNPSVEEIRAMLDPKATPEQAAPDTDGASLDRDEADGAALSDAVRRNGLVRKYSGSYYSTEDRAFMLANADLEIDRLRAALADKAHILQRYAEIKTERDELRRRAENAEEHLHNILRHMRPAMS